MNLPNIKDLVLGGKQVTFVYFRSGELWYRCDDGFEFPVPVSDTEDAIFLKQDRASTFMRYIRKHLEFLAESYKAQTTSEG